MVDRKPITNAGRRAIAVDALRGLAILGMVLAANVPWNLPLGVERWLVHAQTPPPSHDFNPSIPGINGIDLVFPFFLFCLGAAVPLALSRRIEKGVPWWKMLGGILWRGFLLAMFAFYIAHVRPWAMSDNPTSGVWMRGIVAFLVLFPIFLRLPSGWPAWVRAGVRAAGWAAAIALVVTVRFDDGTGPLPAGASIIPRNDSIMWILSNVVVGTSLAWWATRRSLTMRLGVVGALVAVSLGSGVAGGWVQSAWNWKPALLMNVWSGATHLPWLWENSYLMYMLIALPGTIVGDSLLAWLSRDDAVSVEGGYWSKGRYSALAAVSVLLVGHVVWGLFTRDLAATIIGAAALASLGLWLASSARYETEKLVAGIFRWGTYWLAAGLLLEPYEGGIKKDPPTLSFFFTTAGLACMTLLALIVVLDVFKKRRGFSVLAGAGQNPMMAYVGFSNFVQPVLMLTMVTAFMNEHVKSAWGQLAYAVAGTLVMAFLVSICSRKRIYWRA